MDAEMSVVIYRLGPKWDPTATLLKQDHVMGHVRFIRRMLHEGVAAVAGPFCRLDQVLEGDTLGVMVVDLAPDRATAVVAEDPAAANGLVEPEVHPFYPA
jgi:hypothetical protein